jgi:hypothetical protein
MLGAGEIVACVIGAFAVSFLVSILAGLFCAGIQEAEREVEHRIEANYPDAPFEIEHPDLHAVWP